MNMRQLLIVLALMTSVTVSAQQPDKFAFQVPEPTTESFEPKVFDIVEQMPSFGGAEYTVTYTDEKGNTHQKKKVSSWSSRIVPIPLQYHSISCSC